ncbi:MAG: GNAT family N-acetyltransferase [Phycisphaerales bacterium]|nr:GNAT family N-acetyltransferase [Phycisphaerales bacterium]
MNIQPYTPTHRAAWLTMRGALYEEEDLNHLDDEIEEITTTGKINGQPYACLLAIDEDERAIGFIELSLRSTAEECTSSPVVYVEGWYVQPDARQRGVGRALMNAACDWGRERGCTEMGSDTQHFNTLSYKAHLAIGFEDAGLVRHFRRSI